ncbi:hypothetical protein [Fictibacillus sp. KU28468]|uniref:hypothetical protein n=1 Tax=Fictibacillus sp. KU28468 TaxID=2991053 RepID=UPI00223D4197|nr:hypothetical protein [Fictibacillus sp. KU28468]UZJ79564.1 hypothetical protein OKX00_03510 [Fictibacillus sp. KU28468]
MENKKRGPGLVLNSTAELHMSSDIRSWELKADLLIMETNETIFIPTDFKEALAETFTVDRVIIDYKTQQNENLRYTFNIEKKGNDEKRTLISGVYSYKILFLRNI